MRELTYPWREIVGAWAAATAALHIYLVWTAFSLPVLGSLDPLEQRALHLLLLLPLVFLLFPATRASPKHRPSVVDGILVALSTLPSGYVLIDALAIYERREFLTPVEPHQFVLGALMIVLVIEGLRRAVTAILALLVGLVVVYLYFAHLLPGVWNYRQIAPDTIVEIMFLTTGRGIYGPLTGISTTIVSVFMIFGAFIYMSGAGRLFANFGTAAAGRYAGGPAKVAVISSGLFGTMSGSSVSNVATTGAITIPMMKRLGFRPSFGAGVEAAASVGGAILPPVMGAAVFVMVEVTGIAYREIISAAALGAILYYVMALLVVHFEAKRQNLAGLPEKDIPSWRTVGADIHLTLPIALLVVLLFQRYSPQYAALWAIIATVLVSWLRPRTGMRPRAIFDALVQSASLLTVVALAVAGAGMIVAGITTTGLVLAIGGVVQNLAGGHFGLAAVLVMILCLVLGMGVPTTPAYIITSAIGAPVLMAYGPELLGVHLFVFYFAILADATPPVSVASYTAAAIARTNPILTGFEAWRVALGGFVAGFAYIYDPAIMLHGSLLQIATVVVLYVSALTVIAAGFIGYYRLPLAWWARGVALAAGFFVAFGHATPDIYRIGIALALNGSLFLVPSIFRPGLATRLRGGRAVATEPDPQPRSQHEACQTHEK